MIGRRIVLTAVLLSCGRSALALNPLLDVSQYVHTAWRIRDGLAKGAIQAIAQTADGYLWLGTDAGLLRFDGIKSTPWSPQGGQLPSNNIIGLVAGRDGALWIGTDQGLVTWKDGKLTQYEALKGRRILRFLEDREGTVWLVRPDLRTGGRDLCRLQETQVECFGEGGGAGAGAIGLFESRGGTLWVGLGNGGVWRWKPGEPRYFPAPPVNNGLQAMSEADDGSLLVVMQPGIGRVAGDTIAMAYPFPPSITPVSSTHMLRDHDGGLWVATASSGLMHVHNGITDVYGRSNGLSGDRVFRLFEDREGDIWVATVDGLDRFRDAFVPAYSSAQGLSTNFVASVQATRDGTVWIGTTNGLNRLRNNRVSAYGARTERVGAIFQDHLGAVWVSMGDAVGTLDDGRFVPVQRLDRTITRAIVEDADHLWIVNDDSGLTMVSPEKRIIGSVPWGDLHVGRPNAVAANRHRSGLWIGFLGGGVSHVVDGRLRASYGVRDGLGAGAVHHLRLESDGTLWASTAGGLSRLKDGRVTTLTTANGLPCDETYWTVNSDYAMWLGSGCGLLRIERREIDAWSATVDRGLAAPALRPIVFDITDGARVRGGSYFGDPAATGTDGRIYFVSDDGVGVIDSHYLPYNRLPPPVHVEQLVADHKAYETAGSVKLPALTRDLEIDYTALSLIAPEKNRFKVRLEGWDRDWQDVGNRRQVFYNNLAPRSYRFRVIASNNSGVWNETGSSLDFVIPPAYYQTTWFAALVGGTLLALAWAAYRVRVRIVERHQHEISALNERLMKAQEQERIRIAGELHDGVMQQLLGVTMMLGTAKRKITGNAEAQASIDKIQQKLIQTGTDIRQLSHGLHPPLLQDEGLPGALRSYCEQFSAASNIPVSCEVDDTARELSRGAALALFRITQEALGNAAKHAKAKRITVAVNRANGTIALTISDDGVGFDRSQLGTSGGLGLVMMRERAGQLNGTFEFESAPGRGTTIQVVIPFR